MIEWREIFVAAGVSLVLGTSTSSAQQVIDGTSQISFEASAEAMVSGLSEEDQAIFSQGMINLILTEYPPARGLEGFELLMLGEAAVDAAPRTLDGYTFEQIMERGRELASDDAHPSANSTGSPASAIDAATAERACIQDLVRVVGARFVRGDYGMATLEFDVSNGLPFAIAGIHLDYVLRGAGRSVPWEQDDFFLSISGGIEPEETRTIRTNVMVTRDAGDQLIVEADILDVTDPQLRLLVADRRVSNWPEDESPMECVE